MSKAQELKPCPFCGGEAWLNDYEAKHSDMPARSRCPQCKSCGCSLWYHPTEAKAIAAWNRRADLVPAPSVTVKPLEWAHKPVPNKNCYIESATALGLEYEAYGGGAWAVNGSFHAVGKDRARRIHSAKAAAQADYEARIMAAIRIDPAPPSEDQL